VQLEYAQPGGPGQPAAAPVLRLATVMQVRMPPRRPLPIPLVPHDRAPPMPPHALAPALPACSCAIKLQHITLLCRHAGPLQACLPPRSVA